MSITNTIDTDLIVLSYIEPSILTYIKTVNSDFYDLVKNILDNNKFVKLTKALINTPRFLENYFDHFNIDKTDLLNICVKHELNLDGLKWLHHIKKCEPNKKTFSSAALNGNLDTLKWMLDNNFPKDVWTFAYAAEKGNFHILKWMFENNFPKDEQTFAIIALNGNFDILKWMFDNHFPKNEKTFIFATYNGNLDILKWMFDNNFPKDEYAITCAIKIGKLDILKWMFHNNFPYSNSDLDILNHLLK